MSKNRIYWLCQMIGWLGMVMIEVLNYTFFIVGKFNPSYLFFFLVNALLGIGLSHGLKRLLAQWDFFHKNSTVRIWLGALLCTLALSVLLTFANIGMNILLGSSLRSELQLFSLLGFTLNWMRYVGVWVIIYFLYKIMDINAALREEKLGLENLAKSTELELLRTQLNPHFLFNALNSIKALVSIDPAKSRDAIVLLAEILRFTLNYSQQTTITLRAEIEEVQKYLQLELIRFGPNLSISWQVEESVHQQVIPPGTLLTLVENAIKHGQADAQGRMMVRIELKLQGQRLAIDVANNGSWQPNLAHQGMGLRLIQRRLEAIYGPQAEFTQQQNGTLVMVQIRLPKSMP